MGRFVLRRSIQAPATSVFRAFTEPVLTADWMNARGIEDVDGPLDRAGSTYTLVIAGPWRFAVTVIRSEPPTYHETFHAGRLGASARLIARLTERAGFTDLELTTEYTVPFGPLGRWLDRRFLESGPRTQSNREIDRLVQLIRTAPA
jgi:hypothetical protein